MLHVAAVHGPGALAGLPERVFLVRHRAQLVEHSPARSPSPAVVRSPEPLRVRIHSCPARCPSDLPWCSVLWMFAAGSSTSPCPSLERRSGPGSASPIPLLTGGARGGCSVFRYPFAVSRHSACACRGDQRQRLLVQAAFAAATITPPCCAVSRTSITPPAAVTIGMSGMMSYGCRLPSMIRSTWPSASMQRSSNRRRSAASACRAATRCEARRARRSSVNVAGCVQYRSASANARWGACACAAPLHRHASARRHRRRRRSLAQIRDTCTTPTIGVSPCDRPSSVPQAGEPLMNERVPSIGSMTQPTRPCRACVPALRR